MLVILLLGFSSGLPLALIGGTLQAWMQTLGVDLKTIGLFASTQTPYAFKYLWAPLLDRFTPGFGRWQLLDRRRGWMLLSQIALVLLLIKLSVVNPASNPWLVAVLAVGISFASATQDIVIDAYRTEILSTEEHGAGAGLSILGYRLGMLVSSAFALILADHLPWSDVYRLMAAFVGVGMVATFLAPSPDAERARPPRNLREAVIAPFLDFFGRRGALEILLFIVLYKIGDVFAAALSTPFMLELGFSKTDIGAVSKGIGLVATIVGSIVGGALMARFGLKRSLWYFGLLQAVSSLSFYALALVGRDIVALTVAIGLENLCGGFGTAALTAFLMGLCNVRFTATQYALLSSVTAIGRILAGTYSGFIAAPLGWPAYFLFSTAIAIPALILLKLRFERWTVTAAPAASRSA